MNKDKELVDGSCCCWNEHRGTFNKITSDNYKVCAHCEKKIYPQRTTVHTIGAYHFRGLHFHADRGCLVEFLVKHFDEALSHISRLAHIPVLQYVRDNDGAAIDVNIITEALAFMREWAGEIE